MGLPTGPRVTIRSPVVEEFLRQQTEIAAKITGSRGLLQKEIDLGRSIFVNSIDYSRVSLMRSVEALWFTVVGNVIRIPNFFTVSSPTGENHPLPPNYSVELMREIFLHELTHVWQYQHKGTGYISLSLQSQAVAIIRGKGRNAAYTYTLDKTKKFTDFTPEQQAMIVQNTYRMRAGRGPVLVNGTAADGQAPLDLTHLREVHESYIESFKQSPPVPSEEERRTQFAEEISPLPVGSFDPTVSEQKVLPITPLLKISF